MAIESLPPCAALHDGKVWGPCSLYRLLSRLLSSGPHEPSSAAPSSGSRGAAACWAEYRGRQPLVRASSAGIRGDSALGRLVPAVHARGVPRAAVARMGDQSGGRRQPHPGQSYPDGVHVALTQAVERDLLHSEA